MNKFFSIVFTVALLCLALVGCSSTNKAYYDTIKLALASEKPLSLPIEKVLASRADLLKVRHGERNTAVMALAYIENGQNKWVSADSAQLHMHNGVIVRTHGLNQDMLYTSDLDKNPLSDPLPLSFDWSREVDIKGMGYGLTVTSQWKAVAEEAFTEFSASFPVQRIEETVSFPKTTPYIETGLTWTNTYWVSQENGELLKASVKITPQSDRFEMTYLSRAARLLNERK